MRKRRKGDGPETDPESAPNRHPLTALSLLHPFSNRGHCSTFQPFNFSTAPKARRRFHRRTTRFPIHDPLAARLGGAP